MVVDIMQRPEATHAFETSECDDHLRLMVRIFIDVRIALM